MSEQNLLYTDVEDALRESVRSLLSARCPAERVIGVYDGDRAFEPELWRALAVDLGLAGLLVPEEHGGAGATARDAAVVLEELGRFAAPVPFLTSAVVATAAVQHAGDTALLKELAAGERVAALVLPLTTGPGGPEPAVRAEGGRLSGRVSSVAGATTADVLLVPVAVDGGLELHRVAADAPGVEVVAVPSLDMTRPVADVSLDGAESTVLADAATGAAAVQEALRLGAALLASEQLGVADWCLQSTVEYLRERKQFGRAVGGFQAIKHRLADLWVQVGHARAAARYAAATAAAGDDDFPVAAALAQSYCSDVAVHAAEECVQLHGGIGMTWEHPAHVYLKRAKADQLALGTPAQHNAVLADLVDLPA